MPQSFKGSSSKRSFWQVLKKSSLSFLGMTPLLVGVIGLVGIFQVLVTPEMIGSLFKGSILTDTLIGTVSGGVSVGNPIVSYVIGGELAVQGISLYAVSAFILSWVTLGIVQLPAEIEVFGGRFTLYRNLLSFVFTICIAIATGFSFEHLS